VAAACTRQNEAQPSVYFSNQPILPHFGKFRKFLSPIRCFSPTADHPDRVINAKKPQRIDMKTKTLAQALLFSGVAACFCNSQGWAAGGAHCQEVGGGVLTNFLDATQCASPVGLCTDGPVTGDLQGAVGVQVLGINGNVYHVRHHWVTESGDTIVLKDAFLTAFPASDPNRALADYLDGVDITGGTGRFDGATGHLSSVFGAVDLNLGQITLRYAGTVCFRPSSG
jgi:hypothetical protein